MSESLSTESVFLSLVVPVFNEEEVIERCYQAVSAACQSITSSYEVIFIDDGSRDRTVEILKRLHASDPHIRIIELTRNFGQSSATTAGLAHAQGTFVAVIDADLQSPPEYLKPMLERLEEGYDVVFGGRADRREDPWIRKLASRAVQRVFTKACGIDLPEDITTFRIMRHWVAQALATMPEREIWHSGLIHWMGARYTVLPVPHRGRMAGQSKYTYWKLIVMTLDLMVGFSMAPLRWMGLLGALFACAGFGYGGYVVLMRLFYGAAVPGFSALATLITVLTGIQLISVSLLGEYLGRTYAQVQNRPKYLIRRKTSSD